MFDKPIGYLHQRRLWPSEDLYHKERPHFTNWYNRTVETMDTLPNWSRYGHYVTLTWHKWRLTDMEAIDKYGHFNNRQWRKLLGLEPCLKGKFY